MTSNVENKINLFMNIDNNYAVPAYITLYSLLKNHRSFSDIVVYILCNKDVSLKNKQLIESLSLDNNYLEIVFLDMNDEYNDVTINIDHITCSAMYRLMIPRIVKQLHLKIDKCIYIDTDIVVEGDIAELYNIDSNWDKYYCAGVIDPCCFEKKYKGHEKRLDIPSMDRYINSGVILFNTKQIDQDDLTDKLANAGYRNDFLHNDQDAINSVLYSGIKTIPLRFNMMRTLFYHNRSYISYRYSEKEALEAKNHPFIIHFIDHQKPWSHKSVLLADKWWKYVKMQSNQTKKKYINPFVVSHTVPLSEMFFEAVKTVLAHLCVYDLISSITKKIR